eukprot:TRINITY_DN434_c0_g1_i1.p1 TRINITY_DN434_c0_g1~~TRINITY_DN434_c0_g1_i1.p1  ORF type:complete len:194 (-),score=28.33 TRINITY_DN434_c0_g1_i1:148-729(-)
MVYRIVMLGAGGVGKSCITVQLTQKIFVASYEPTIENSYKKELTVDDKSVMLDVLDTAGQEDFEILRDTYIRSGDGVVLVYSITSRDSFSVMPEMRQSVIEVKELDKFPMVVVGNKKDLESEREVSTDEGEEFAKKYNMPFFESSAKERINIEDIFVAITREIANMTEMIPKASSTTAKPTNKEKETGCCLIC